MTWWRWSRRPTTRHWRKSHWGKPPSAPFAALRLCALSRRRRLRRSLLDSPNRKKRRRPPLSRHYGEEEVGGHLGLVEDRLARGDSLGALAEALAGIKVAIEARKVAGADFEADTVAGQEDVTGRP